LFFENTENAKNWTLFNFNFSLKGIHQICEVVPQFVPLLMFSPQLVKSEGGIEKLWQPIRWAKHVPQGPGFFLLGKVAAMLDFCCSQMCSHQILNEFFKCLPSSQCVPKHVPDSTSLYPISFALSSTFITYTITPKGGDYNRSILGLFKALLNFFVMGQSKMPITKVKKYLDFGVPTTHWDESNCMYVVSNLPIFQ
jgi:hypothetical protein